MRLPQEFTEKKNLVRLLTISLSITSSPHSHPRATEILTVIEGEHYVGFVASNSDDGNRLFAKTLKKVDVFVFPKGHIHFKINVVKAQAFAIAALSSQNPGVITVANAVFGSNPPISDDVLEQPKHRCHHRR